MRHLCVLGAVRDCSHWVPNCREGQQLTEDSPLWTLDVLSVHSSKAAEIPTYPESQSNFHQATQPLFKFSGNFSTYQTALPSCHGEKLSNSKKAQVSTGFYKQQGKVLCR